MHMNPSTSKAQNPAIGQTLDALIAAGNCLEARLKEELLVQPEGRIPDCARFRNGPLSPASGQKRIGSPALWGSKAWRGQFPVCGVANRDGFAKENCKGRSVFHFDGKNIAARTSRCVEARTTYVQRARLYLRLAAEIGV